MRTTGPGTSSQLSFGKLAVYAVLLVYCAAVIYPLLWLVLASLKPDDQIFLHPFALPTLDRLQWSNFSHAWTAGHFRQYFFNSVLLTVSTVAVTTLLASMTAYAVSRFRFPAFRAVYFYFLAGLMVPVQLAIVPLFFEVNSFGLLNTRAGLFLIYLAFGFPFAVFVLTGFFRSLPRGVYESAVVDGCSEWRAFWHVMLPMARPGIVTVAIFLFLGNWNEFFVAFVCVSGPGSEAVRTLPLGLAKITIVSQYSSDWGLAFAGLVLMMLPVLVAYLFLQKQLTRGITAGALKG